MVELELTPSSFEKVQTLGEAETEKEDRPMGNVFGNVMHRSFELYVRKYKESNASSLSEEEFRALIRIAIMESAAEIDERYKNKGGYEKNALEFEEYLLPRLMAFSQNKEIKECFEKAGDRANIHPEYNFSFTSAFGDFKKDMPQASQELLDTYDNIADDTKVWVHGISDLVIFWPSQREVLIIDYKSDAKRISETVEDFEKRLYSKYSLQLAFYEYAMKRAFGEGVEVRSRLYHLY